MNDFLVILTETAYVWKYMSIWLVYVYMDASLSVKHIDT